MIMLRRKRCTQCSALAEALGGVGEGGGVGEH